MSFAQPQFYSQQQQFRPQSRDRINPNNYPVANIIDNYQIPQQIPQQIITNSNSINLEQRLLVIESNINKLCKQQEYLSPLLSLNEKLPNLINESILNAINAKELENEEHLKQFISRINQLENQLKKQEVQLNDNTQQFEHHPVIVSLNEKAESLTICITDLQNDFISQQSLNQVKIEEEKLQFKEIEEIIENYKETFSKQIEKIKAESTVNLKQIQHYQQKKNDYQTNIQQSFNKDDIEQLIDKKIGIVVAQVSDSIAQQIASQVEQQNKQLQQTDFIKKFEQLTSQFEDETNNLYKVNFVFLIFIYKEIGQIKCEINQITSTFRKSYIEEKINEFPKSLNKIQYNLKLNNIEEETRINELEQFCEDNSERLTSDCKNIEQKIDKLLKLIKQISTLTTEDYAYIKSEIEFLTQRYVDLNYQSGGAKKKYAFDMRKIEEKTEQIKEIEELFLFVCKSKQGKQQNLIIKQTKKKKMKLMEKQSFKKILLNELVQSLFQLINQNIDVSTQQLEILETKLTNCKTQFEQL